MQQRPRDTPWRATVLTVMPEMFPGPLGLSLAGRALAASLWQLETLEIRRFATDRHRSIDDTPAGGGPGMVMKPDVLARALDAVGDDGRPRVLMSPRGLPLDQARVETLAKSQFKGTPLSKKVRWYTEVTVHDTVKMKQHLPAIRATGCRALWLGVEDMTASLVKKGQSVNATMEAFEYAARLRAATATCSLSSDRSNSTKSF